MGNSISLRIFRTPALKKLSASFYLSAICISDTCVLLTYVLLDWLNKGLPRWPGGHRVPLVNIQGICQTFLFFSYTFRIISVWLIIIFTFERYVAICWPLKRPLICTRSFSMRMICCVSIMAAFLCIYKPVISGVYKAGNVNVCSKLLKFDKLNFILDSIYGVLITALPFIIITLLNILILRRLVCRRKSEMEIRSTSKESRMRYEFTIILLSISTCFVCLNIPYFIVWCYQRLSIVSKPDPSHNNYTSSLGHMVISAQNTNPLRDELLITRTIFYINYCCNFFLYCLTGKQYRKYMKHFLLCRQEVDLMSRRGSSYRSVYTSQSYVSDKSYVDRKSSAQTLF